MKTEKTFVVGITGGIASGKSEVRRILQTLGCIGIDADQTAHDLLEMDGAAVMPVVEHFGREVLQDALQPDPRLWLIDRRRLARIVFADDAALTWLEDLTHPLITQLIAAQIRTAQQPVTVEAIKLMESDLKDLCDLKWLVQADEDVRIERMMRTRKMAYDECKLRIEAQREMDWHLAEIDAVIDSGVALEQMRATVTALWENAVGEFSLV